jgi:hypothetical protein
LAVVVVIAAVAATAAVTERLEPLLSAPGVAEMPATVRAASCWP